MRDKSWRQEPGGRRDDTCDHGLSRGWKVEVCEEKKEKSRGIGTETGCAGCLLVITLSV